MTNADRVRLTDQWADVVQANNTIGLRITAVLGFTFYPAFGILDYLLATEDYPVIWASRAAITVISLVIFALTFTSVGRRYSGVLGSVLILAGGAGIALMIRYIGGYASPYYAGLCLLIVVTGLVFTWDVFQAALTHAANAALFIVPALLLDTIEDIAIFASNCTFLGTMAMVVTLGQVVNYRLRHREFTNAQLVLEGKQALEEAHEQLMQLDRFKSQVFANITHELKTPLAMILTPLELALHGELGGVTDERRDVFQSMYRNALKLLKMIGDILDLSKLAESRIRLKIAEHDLRSYLGGLIAQVQPLAQHKEIRLDFDAPIEPSLVWCDLDRIERVFVNLLSNAAKFTPEGGWIRVSLEQDADSVVVEVEDSGPGVPEGMTERVFERFFQVEMGSTRRHGGSGIGLALARELVELHEGRISVTSAPDRGACFRVELRKGRDHFDPEVLDRRVEDRGVVHGNRADDRGISDWAQRLANEDDYRLIDIAEATERRVVARGADEQRRPYTVLVVEDTADVIRVVNLCLSEHFRVMAAEDGLKGLDLAQKVLPDLIITDLMMPGMDGLELTRQLREDVATRHIPIVMLTARGDLEDRLTGLETGANAYLTKPFSHRELLTTVRALLDIQQTQADLLLEQRMDSLEAVAGGLAHEINNPLNYLKNALVVIRSDTRKVAGLVALADGREATSEEAAQLEKLRARIDEMYSIAEAGIRRIGRTVDTMRAYSREGYSRARRPHDVFAGIEEVIEVVRPAIGRDVEVSTSFVGDGTVECVPEEVHQAFTNLIQNAIEAAPEDGGWVRIEGRRERELLRISVRDNGPGIPPEVASRIYTPFFSTKGAGGGMGMGLTITWRVVRALGGTLDLSSEPGQGAEFVVRLPVVAPALVGCTTNGHELE